MAQGLPAISSPLGGLLYFCLRPFRLPLAFSDSSPLSSPPSCPLSIPFSLSRSLPPFFLSRIFLPRNQTPDST